MAHRGGQDDVAQVRHSTDLVSLIGEHVALRQRGREYVGLCPFHDDSNPSFAVVVHKAEPFYKCHACGAAGDCFNFVMDYHKMDFPAALRYLAERAGITLTSKRSGHGESGSSKRDTLLAANAAAHKFFRHTLTHDAGATARQAMSARGYDQPLEQTFQLGASPASWDALVSFIHARNLPLAHFIEAGLIKSRREGSGHYDTFRNRLIFPILDELNRPIAFGGRCLHPDDDPKYLNSPESPLFDKSRTLFGLPQAKRSIIDSRQAIVTEGYTDVITCHQHGFTNVVATLGTALTPQHTQVLNRLCDSVVLLFDGDQAGQKAADRAVEVFFASRLDVRICILPESADPDDLLRSEDGPERFAVALDQAIDALEYKIGRMRDEVRAMTSMSARHIRIEEMVQDLARLGFGRVQGVRKAMIVQQVASVLNVPESEIAEALRLAAAANAERFQTRTSGDSHNRGSLTTGPQQRNLGDPSERMASAPRPQNVRQRAERELIGLVLHDPEVLGAELTSPAERGPATVLDWLRTVSFSDASCQRITATVIEQHSGGNLRSSDVLHCLEPADRSLATDLMISSRDRFDSLQADVRMMAADACSTLSRLIEREHFELELASLSQDDVPSEHKLGELIELRRRQDFVGNRMPSIRS